MIRAALIERVLRMVYGGLPTDDSMITDNLVNQYIIDGTAIAAKQNYKEAVQLDGVGYVNNAFYSTFKGIAVTKDENFLYRLTLPQLPVGIGRNEGISTLQFKDSAGNLTYPCIPISESQKGYFQTMRPIPNKTLFYNEGTYIYAISTAVLTLYTATVSMISGGDETDLNSILNVPPEYIPIIIEYATKMLMAERNQPQDTANDGASIK